MLEQILHYLKNWFMKEIYTGSFVIEGGRLTLPALSPGQYFRVVGSVFNDGLHKDGETLTDEAFEGAVWLLAIPKAVVSISEDMAAWAAKNGDAGLYTSESFGGYSYSRATTANGKLVGAFEVFGDRLAPYKKIRETCTVHPVSVGTPPIPRKNCGRWPG